MYIYIYTRGTSLEQRGNTMSCHLRNWNCRNWCMIDGDPMGSDSTCYEIWGIPWGSLQTNPLAMGIYDIMQMYDIHIYIYMAPYKQLPIDIFPISID